MIEKRVCLKTITVHYRRVTDSSAGAEPAQNPLGNFRWINKQRDVVVRQLIFYKEMISLFLYSPLPDPGPIPPSPIFEDICPAETWGGGGIALFLVLSSRTNVFRARLCFLMAPAHLGKHVSARSSAGLCGFPC